MNSVTVSDPEHLAVLRRSALLELLSLGFSYPTEERLHALEDVLEDLAQAPPWPEDLRRAAQAVLSTLRQSSAGELQATYNALFSGEPVCSPYEAAYRARDRASPQITADVAGFYRAFRLSAKPGSERPDHIAAELEFLALLLRRRIYAEAAGLEEAASVAREAEASFIADHLGLWLGDFLGRVRERTKSRFYANLADVAAVGPIL